MSDTIDIKLDENGKPPRVLSFLSLLAIAYFAVSGGPYGIEGAISSGPPVYVLLTFFILPLLWSLPTGMVTAELSNAFSEDGGASMWADHAFGGNVSLMVGCISWVANIVDLALYPVLFVQYLGGMFIGTKFEDSQWGGQLENCFNCKWFLAFIVIITITLVNMWGAEKVGASSKILSIILLLPFVLMVIVGIGHVDFKHIWNGDGGWKAHRKVQLGTLVPTVIWSISGYDSIGQLAGEVKNPSRNYPLGVLCVMIITIITYVLPVIVGLQYDQDWSNWQSGQFSTIAYTIGGHWLGIIMSVGGMASSIGLFNCNLCTISRNLYSMSERGHLPAALSRLLPRRGTPYVAIIFNAIVVATLTLLPFNSILDLDMTMYSLVVAIESITYIYLFIKRPDLPRPYRAIKHPALLTFIASPIFLAFVVIYTTPLATKIRGIVALCVISCFVLLRFLLRKYNIGNNIFLTQPLNHNNNDDSHNQHHHSKSIQVADDDDENEDNSDEITSLLNSTRKSFNQNKQYQVDIDK